MLPAVIRRSRAQRGPSPRCGRARAARVARRAVVEINRQAAHSSEGRRANRSAMRRGVQVGGASTFTHLCDERGDFRGGQNASVRWFGSLRTKRTGRGECTE
eukprot:6202930-Pleurochrysis_carterae.AAC.2